MEIHIPKQFSQLKPHFGVHEVLNFWNRRYRLVYGILFLFVLGYGGGQWYYSVYKFQWNEEQKKKYWESYANETGFRENRFRDAVGRIERRARANEEKVFVDRDIFVGEK